MLKSLLLIAGLLIMAAPAEAHKSHHHQYDAFFFYSGNQHGPRQPKIRLNENCVWKPWKEKVICRYEEI